MASRTARLRLLAVALVCGCGSEQVPEAVPAPVAVEPAALTIPGSFAGELPCAECDVLQQTLTLREDGLYVLERRYLGLADRAERTRVELGGWEQSPERARLVLHNAIVPLQAFEITSPRQLRQLDHNGNPIRTQQPYELHRLPALHPHDQPVTLRGTYDGSFRECGSGRSFTIAPELEGATLLGAARSLPSGGGGLHVLVLGQLAERPASGGGREQVLVVHRYAIAEPDASCSSELSPLALEDRDWTLIELEGRARPRRGTLRLISSDRRVRAWDGCERSSGSYRLLADGVRFPRLVVTRRQCRSDPALERVLGDVDNYAIDDWELELRRGHRVLARFDASGARSRAGAERRPGLGAATLKRARTPARAGAGSTPRDAARHPTAPARR